MKPTLLLALLAASLNVAAHPGHGSHSNAVEAVSHQWSSMDVALVGIFIYFLGGSLMRLAKGALTVRRPVDE